jgi:hypothetical protein
VEKSIAKLMIALQACSSESFLDDRESPAVEEYDESIDFLVEGDNQDEEEEREEEEEEEDDTLVDETENRSPISPPPYVASVRSSSKPNLIVIPTQKKFRISTLNRRCLFFNEDLKGKTASIVPKSPANAHFSRPSPKASSTPEAIVTNFQAPTFSPMSANSAISNLSSAHGEELSEMDLELLREELLEEAEYEQQTSDILNLYDNVSESGTITDVDVSIINSALKNEEDAPRSFNVINDRPFDEESLSALQLAC